MTDKTKFTKEDIEEMLLVLAEEYRPEALKILNEISIFRLKEMYEYYITNKHNSFCMHLDLLKLELVHYKILEQNENDHFGKPFWMNED